MVAPVLPAFALLSAGPVTAQVVSACNDYRSAAAAIAEPWEANTATFANGNIRLAIMDVLEPAAGAVHLLILSPPRAELGDRQCRVVSMADMGFGNLTLQGLVASYDPAAGLQLMLQASHYDPATADFRPAVLNLTINQATGDIRATLTAR